MSETSGFLSGVDKVIALLGCYATYYGRFSKTFRHNISVRSSRAKQSNRILFDCLTLKDETDSLTCKIDIKLPNYAPQHRRKAKNLSLVGFIFKMTSVSLKINILVELKPLNICGSVHHAFLVKIIPTRCNYCGLFFANALLYMFRVTIPPIIRSTCAVYGHR